MLSVHMSSSIQNVLVNNYSSSFILFCFYIHLDSVVDPSSAFTISKNGSDIGGDSAVVAEQKPPSYASSASVSPPPYASINP